MNTDQEFEALRRLLKLKRHEQPPPRYFNDFSSQVIGRIRAAAPEDRPRPLENLEWESPLLRRILSLFESKPVAAAGFGAAVCALLLGGMMLLQDGQLRPPGAMMQQSPAEVTVAGPTPFVHNGSPFAGNSSPSITPVANGLVSPADTNSIFDMLRPELQPHVERVDWRTR